MLPWIFRHNKSGEIGRLSDVECRKKGEDEIEILTFLALPKRDGVAYAVKVEKCEFRRREICL